MVATEKKENERPLMRLSRRSLWHSQAVMFICLVFALGSALGSESANAAGSPQAKQATAAKQGGKTPSDQPIVPVTKPVDNDYIIGPSDVLAINVWKDTELTRGSVLVRPDGKISLPLAGELMVSGLTPPMVQSLIVQRLKEYISNPQVTVIVQEVKSRTYVIVGKVMKPGSFELGKPTTVLEAFAIAGGPQDFAKTNKIYIIRRLDDGSTTRLPFDYKSVIKGRHTEENITLKSGDTIVVP